MTAKDLNTKALMQAFAVSHMTINAWRKGSETKGPLPVIALESRDVRFKPAAVKAWAKDNKVEVFDHSALIPGNVLGGKSGPKAPPVKKSALRTKAVSKPSPKKLAKIIARAKKPLPRPGEVGYKVPAAKLLKATAEANARNG